jgi:hypothetical protein
MSNSEPQPNEQQSSRDTMDDAFGETDTDNNSSPKRFSDEVLSHGRNEDGTREPVVEPIDWNGDTYLIEFYAPTAKELKGIASQFEGRDDSDIEIEEVESVFENRLVDPTLADLEENLRMAEYAQFLFKAFEKLAGAGGSGDFQEKLQDELDERLDEGGAGNS